MTGRRRGEIVDDIAGLRRILAQHRTLAVVGLSQHWYRPSYFAAKYMLDHGYTVIPVNPGYAEALGQKKLVIWMMTARDLYNYWEDWTPLKVK